VAKTRRRRTNVIGASATWLAKAIRTGRISSEEAVSAHIEQIGAMNPHLNAVVRTEGHKALIQARVVARNWRDDVALSAARTIERALGGWRPASVIP
jgi:Asp-tRNA(Asn)/Glu-tRNA(Gln) amidotransferase A subunit family amidase